MFDTGSRPTVNWKLVLKTIAFVVLYVGAVAAGIPALLLWWADGRLDLGLGNLRYLGLVPVIVGPAFHLYCTVHLAAHGKGIPAPLDPTQQLTASGPYAIVRNPMYGAASLYFLGLAIVADSGILVAYALLMISAYQAGVVLLEEPALARRFGASFEDYCRQTPRWLPSFRHIGKTMSHRVAPSARPESRSERQP